MKINIFLAVILLVIVSFVLFRLFRGKKNPDFLAFCEKRYVVTSERGNACYDCLNKKIDITQTDISRDAYLCFIDLQSFVFPEEKLAMDRKEFLKTERYKAFVRGD